MAKEVFDSTVASRLNSYRIDPRNLKPDPVLNGRVKLPDIAKFRADFLNPAIGQVQSITIAKVDGEPVIIDGVTRWRAALELTNEGTGPHEGGVFFLKCQYSPAKTPMERYILTVKANIRNEPTPEDDAHSIAIFLHTFSQTEAYVAEHVYGRFTLDGKPDLAWVRERNALNDLTSKALEALREGKLKSKAAIALAKLTPKEQKAKLELLDAGQKLTVAAIKRVAPVVGTSTTSEASPTPPAKRKWDKKAFCELLQSYIDADLPPHTARMTAENAVRTVLGQIQEEIECGQ